MILVVESTLWVTTITSDHTLEAIAMKHSLPIFIIDQLHVGLPVVGLTVPTNHSVCAAPSECELHIVLYLSVIRIVVAIVVPLLLL